MNTFEEIIAAQPHTAFVVYDGDCPFCSRFVALVRLREAVGEVFLVNARENGDLVTALRSLGYSLDEGMALVMNGQIYHGADCMNRLALLSSQSTYFNKLNALLFRNSMIATMIYPMLRFFRNLTISILGQPMLGDSDVVIQKSGMTYGRYRAFTKALFVSLLSYFLIAESQSLQFLKLPIPSEHGEIFPFFNWSLFSYAGRYSSRYSIVPKVVPETATVNWTPGKILDFGEAPFLKNIRFWKIGNFLKRAIEEGENEKIESLIQQIQSFVRYSGVTEYRLVRIIYDPLKVGVERKNRIVEIQIIHEFSGR